MVAIDKSGRVVYTGLGGKQDLEGAIKILALYMAPLDQHLAQPQGAARLIDENGR